MTRMCCSPRQMTAAAVLHTDRLSPSISRSNLYSRPASPGRQAARICGGRQPPATSGTLAQPSKAEQVHFGSVTAATPTCGTQPHAAGNGPMVQPHHRGRSGRMEDATERVLCCTPSEPQRRNAPPGVPQQASRASRPSSLREGAAPKTIRAVRADDRATGAWIRHCGPTRP